MIDLQLPMGMRNRLKAFQNCIIADKDDYTYQLFIEGKASLTDVTKVMIKSARMVGRSTANNLREMTPPINTHNHSN
jgi:hypothetical protein